MASIEQSPNPLIRPKPIIENGEVKGLEPFSEYFNDSTRIRYLLTWTLDVLPLIEAIKKGGTLPAIRDGRDFSTYFNNLIDTYSEAIHALPSQSVITSDDIRIFELLCVNLKSAVSTYMAGQPSKAYMDLLKALDEYDRHFDFNEIAMNMSNRSYDLYRIRLGEESFFNTMEMFHIPFEKRGLVKTNRYSIPGLPCLYLGSTPFICWEEMGRPDKQKVHTSLFMVNEDVTFLEFSVPPNVFVEHAQLFFEHNFGEDLTALYSSLRLYTMMWPLIAACSIQVKNTKDAFKPEYIIPQLLLQWVQQSGKYDGICYFSTRFKKYTYENFSYFRNYAFPVKQNKVEGYCEKLMSLFSDITDGVPWPLFEIQKPAIVGGGYGKPHASLELIPGTEVYYHQTDFYLLETLLNNVLYPRH